MRGQRFSELNDAIKTAQEVANILECNVPIYYNAPYYYEHFKKLGYKDLAVWVEYEIKLSSFEKSPEKVKKFSKNAVRATQSKKVAEITLAQHCTMF